MSDYFKGVLIGVLSASLVFVGLHPWTVESQDIAFGNVYSNGVLMSQPSGSLKLITSGTCGTGYSEYTALNGSTLIGTLAANGDVGTTGGSNTITPAGTNGTVAFTPSGTVTAPTFTGNAGTIPAEVISWPVGVPTFAGSAMATHTHTVTAAGTNAATVTSGNTAATNIAAGTGSLTAAKATAPNLTVPAETFTGSQVTSGATSAGTPTGTVAWPAGVPTNATASFTPAGSNSVPTFSGQAGTVPGQVFSGSSFDNRSAFVKVIFCVKS